MDLSGIYNSKINLEEAPSCCGILELYDIGNYCLEAYRYNYSIKETIEYLIKKVNHYRRGTEWDNKYAFITMALVPYNVNFIDDIFRYNNLTSKEKNFFKKCSEYLKKEATIVTRKRINGNTGRKIQLLIF
jgi:hypothetical protein